MKTIQSSFILISILLFAPVGCGSSDSDTSSPVRVETDKDFRAYWNQGLAEITTYELTQARYGELRNGHATMIFVTEPFSIAQQVKSDNPSNEPKGSVEVLKLNMVKKFNTGIYPYSMMNSSFTPTETSAPGSMIKSTCTSQEWCGHTFTQWNKKGNDYELHQFSYFQSEGDVQKTMKNALLEDELWSTIRLAPSQLPTGKVEMIPGNFYSRLKHVDFAPYTAECSSTENGELIEYHINYPQLGRNLSIHFKKDFPHEIEYFEESYKDGWGADAQMLTTTAVKMKRIMSNYWNKNSNADAHLREELGLD